jgi:hypothetical protein
MAADALSQAVHRLPVQSQLAHRLHAHALRGGLQRIAGHDFVGALAHIAERRGIGHAVVDVKRQQAADLRCVLLTAHLLGDKGLLCARTAFVLQLLHVVGHRIDQVVGKLPVAHPGIAKQVEVGLIGLQVA